MIDHGLLITIVATIFLGVTAQIISENTRLPSIIYLLIFGVLAGPDFLNIVKPGLLGDGLYALTFLAIAIILFEGGLTLNILNIKHISRSVLHLISLGALITWIGSSLLAWIFLDISPTIAILFGSLVIVTGPTVIAPLLKTTRVNRKIRTVLKWEGILIDPVGAIIAVLVLGFVISEEASLPLTLVGFFGRIIFGIFIGFAGGLVMSQLMKFKLSESISTLTIFSVIFLMYGVSELLVKESGIMSVTIAGIVMGNMKVRNLQNVKGFKEKLTILLVSVLFILLAANLRISDIEDLGINGLLVVAGIMFIIRPLNIFLSVRDKSFTLKDKLFLSWISPRGIIAASVASLFAFTLSNHGYENSSILLSLTLLTIGITVLLQGVTAKPVAKLLGVLQTGSKGVLILGGSDFSFALADKLKEFNIPVMILDSNKSNCSKAEAHEIETYCGDVLSEEIWDEMSLSNIRSFLTLTTNNELNSLASSKASMIFNKDDIYQVRNAYKDEAKPYLLEMISGNQHYDLALDISEVSSGIHYGSKIISDVKKKELKGSWTEQNNKFILCGIKNGALVFSTDPNDFSDNDTLIIFKDKEE